MKCEHCDCRNRDVYCSSFCGCQSGGSHLCFDENDKYLGCWSYAGTVEELLRIARQVAYSMPKGSQMQPDGLDDVQRPSGWPLALPLDTASGERVAGWVLGEDGALHFLWEPGFESGSWAAQLRWQILEKESALPAVRAGEPLTPEAVSRALVGLLR